MLCRGRVSRVVAMLCILCAMLVIGSQVWAAPKTKITFWTWVNLEEGVKEFEVTHPDIEVEMVKMGAWDLHDKLLVALSAGVGAPDVAQLVIRRFDSYIDTGRLTDITPDVAELRDSYPSALWTAVSRGGRIYGLPSDVGPGVIWYRRDIFEKYGIKAPIATWQEFIEAGKRISNSDQYMMPVYVPSGQWGVANFVMYLQSRGGNLYDENGRLIRNNTILRETLRWYYDLVKTHKIAYPIPYFTPSFWALLDAGKIVTLPANTSEGSNIKRYAANGKWGVMPWPRWSPDSPLQTGVWGGNVYTIPTQTKHKEAALTFVKWLCATPNGQMAYYKYVGGWPVFGPALKAPEIQQPDPFFGNTVVAKQVLGFPTFYWFDEAETTTLLGQAIDDLFSGKVTLDQALSNFEANVKERLGR